ncbi:hypothetical protein DZF99_13265, partial [Clavibacter phaseoli]
MGSRACAGLRAAPARGADERAPRGGHRARGPGRRQRRGGGDRRRHRPLDPRGGAHGRRGGLPGPARPRAPALGGAAGG